MDYKLTPASFNVSVPLTTRRSLVSARYVRATYVEEVRYAFALNCQRNLRLSFHWISAPAVADDVMPEGFNFLAQSGGSVYVVGDGEEGEQILRVGQWMPPGYFCVSGDNISVANAHILDCRMFASQKAEEVGWTKNM